MTTIHINGQSIFARIEGPTSGQIALLIHGWSSSWYAMLPLLPVMSRRFRCVAIDLPGYGNSEPFEGGATIERYAGLVAALARSFSEGPVVLVGHSMGGMISLTTALQSPQLVERMVLLCPTISGKLSNFINRRAAPLMKLEQLPLMSRLVKRFDAQFMRLTDSLMKPASFAERSQISAADYERIRADIRRPTQVRTRVECFDAMRAGDLRGKIGAVETPALVVWGAEDNTVPLRDAGVVADEWPMADLRIVPKAGHWPQFEATELTLRYVSSFLGLPLDDGQPDDTLGRTPDSIAEVARFLEFSDVGGELNLTQRTYLAAQLRARIYPPGKAIVIADEDGDHLFIVRDGCIDVMFDSALPERPGLQRVTTLKPGQIAGELSMLDGRRRSANLFAGSEGASVLTLRRDRLQAICNDDPAIGSRILWNIATALALRLRLTTWQQYHPVESDRVTPV